MVEADKDPIVLVVMIRMVVALVDDIVVAELEHNEHVQTVEP